MTEAAWHVNGEAKSFGNPHMEDKLLNTEPETRR